jgi:hypothetical protein
LIDGQAAAEAELKYDALGQRDDRFTLLAYRLRARLGDAVGRLLGSIRSTRLKCHGVVLRGW